MDPCWDWGLNCSRYNFANIVLSTLLFYILSPLQCNLVHFAVVYFAFSQNVALSILLFSLSYPLAKYSLVRFAVVHLTPNPTIQPCSFCFCMFYFRSHFPSTQLMFHRHLEPQFWCASWVWYGFGFVFLWLSRPIKVGSIWTASLRKLHCPLPAFPGELGTCPFVTDDGWKGLRLTLNCVETGSVQIHWKWTQY